MAVNAYRDKVKRRLGLNEDDDQFDSDIDDFTIEAVNNLYPIVQAELAPETTDLLANENEIDLHGDENLTGKITSVRRLEIQNVEGGYNSTDDYTIHDRTLYLYNSSDYARTIRIQGNGRYVNGTVPIELDQVIINWTMAEFYSLLTGDKRKYTIYTQSTGARSVDNIRDLSDYYLDRGNQLLADRATVRGQ